MGQDVVRKENSGPDDVADNKKGEISGRVVCALRAQVLMANGASRGDPKVGSEHRAVAAIGTAADEAAPKGESKVAASARAFLGGRSGGRGGDAIGRCHVVFHSPLAHQNDQENQRGGEDERRGQFSALTAEEGFKAVNGRRDHGLQLHQTSVNPIGALEAC